MAVDQESDDHAPSLASQLWTLVHLCESPIFKPGYLLVNVVMGKENGSIAFEKAGADSGHPTPSAAS
jgi:hypothetical protein